MSRRELSATEPRAVASGINGTFFKGRLTKCQTKVCPYSARYRSRFCNLRSFLLIGFLCEARSDVAIWSRMPVRCQTWA